MEDTELTEKQEECLEGALDLLDDGNPAAALRELDGLPAAEPEVAGTAIEAWLELGEPGQARSALEAGSWPPDDPDRLWLEGQVLLREWRIEEAERAFSELHDRSPAPLTLNALALCRELVGDLTGADALHDAAAQLDPTGHPVPVRLDAAAFDQVVQEAVQELPPEFQAAIGDLRFLIEPMPERALLRGGDPGAVPPDLLGLFSGPTLGELGDGHAEAPVVHLFQRNIERVARDHDELRLEIRTTLYHEIGHFLGHDEEGVEAMGLG